MFSTFVQLMVKATLVKNLHLWCENGVMAYSFIAASTTTKRKINQLVQLIMLGMDFRKYAHSSALNLEFQCYITLLHLCVTNSVLFLIFYNLNQSLDK